MLKKPAAQLLKRPAGRPDFASASKKRPAAAVLEAAGIRLAERAPVYLPSKRPRPEKVSGDEAEEAPKTRRKRVNEASFRQSSLRALESQMPPLLQLHLCGGGIDRPAVLDFTIAGFSLPELQDLLVQNWPLKKGIFLERVFPRLRSLHVSFPFDGEPGTPKDWEGFNVALPELKSLVLESPGSVQPEELKASTRACSKLTYFCLYKVYVETLSIVLPNARNVWLHRLELLKYLSVYGPCLQELRLQACYDLNKVRILLRAPGIAPIDAPSTFAVDLTNSCIPREAIQELREHPRVKYVVLPFEDDSVTEDEQGSQHGLGPVFRIGHLMKPPGLNKVQLEGSLGLSRFGEEIGVNVCQRVQEARSATIEQVARMLEWGAQVVYVWYDVQVSQEALSLARRARVPVEFWDDITAKKTNGRRAMPIICMADAMCEQIQKASN